MSAAGGQPFLAATRRLLLAALVTAAAGGVLWFRGLDRGGEPAPAPEAEGGDTGSAEMVTRNFRHVETRMDRTIWVLEAKRAEIREQKARLNTVRITWYGEPGSPPVVITSRGGAVDFGNRSGVLTGKVRATRADGAVLETERLSFDERSKLLRAPVPVLITTPTFSFRGTALSANLDRRWVRLKGRVEGEIRGVTIVPGNS